MAELPSYYYFTVFYPYREHDILYIIGNVKNCFFEWCITYLISCNRFFVKYFFCVNFTSLKLNNKYKDDNGEK